MPTYKLTHFNVTGRAELPRLLFAYSGTKYEDNRITPQQWMGGAGRGAGGGVREKTPFRVLPILEVDGKVIADSMAIGRYLAKQFGLYGETAYEQAMTDAVVGAVEDYLPVMWQETMITVETDHDYIIKLQEPIGEHMKKSSAKFYRKMEDWLTEQAGSSGYFVGEKITWADIHVFNLVQMTVIIGEIVEPLKAYPKLYTHYNKILSIDNIAQWQKTKPKEVFG